MVDEGDAGRGWQGVVALRDGHAGAARDADGHLPCRWRDAADELRVELQNRRHARIGQAGDHIEPRRLGNRDFVEQQRGQPLDIGEPVPFGLFGDQGRRDQLRHIVARLAPQIPSIRQLEEGMVGQGLRKTVCCW